MKIYIKIGEYDIQGVKESDKVEVTVDAIDKTFDGTITRIDRNATVSGGVSYFPAEVELSGSQDLRSGMSAEVKLIIDDIKQTVAVPSEAVETDDDGNVYVYVRGEDDEEPEKKPVEIGASDGTYTQIKSGLENGDRIVISRLDAYTRMAEEMKDSANMRRNGGSDDE
jgi:multidrug efflux pump subunit AcrA (membrane-fusion protein)